MKTVTACLTLVLVMLTAASAQELRPEDSAIKSQLEASFDIVPLTDAIGLRPKKPIAGVRLIEVSDTISINGTVVSGRELRDRLGDEADAVIKLSYLEPPIRQALFPPRAPEPPAAPQPPEPPVPSERIDRDYRRTSSERVRVFGDVNVDEGEKVSGQVVAVLGSVRVDGEVGDQVVAVLGSVDLGEKAIVHGDVISVGGRVHRAPGAQIRGAVTDISLGDARIQGHLAPWVGGLGVLSLFDGLGALPRLIGTIFRLLLLMLFASAAMIVARSSVEGSAQRVTDQPVKTTIVGLVAELLVVPVLVLTCILLALSIVGIPLLLLMPFVVLFLLCLALVGFAGAALALGQWARRRFRLSSPGGFADIWLGVLIILLPVIAGRVIGLGGFLGGPISILLVAGGVALEFLVWATGFGAILTNGFARWQARRAMRTPAIP